MRSRNFQLLLGFMLLFQVSQAQSNIEEYYAHVHLAEEQLMAEEYEDAFYNYQEAFNRKKGFVNDLLNASCAMLYSKPDVSLLCEWNSQFYGQTGRSLMFVLRNRDKFCGTDFMAKLTPDNWIDLEVCISDTKNDLRNSFYEMLLADSVFSMNWFMEDHILNRKQKSAEVANNEYALYDILPLNRFIVSKKFNQVEAGEWVMDWISKLLNSNLNLDIAPVLRGMKYKVQQGEIDNRYYSKLCDRLVRNSAEIRMDLRIDEQQAYYTNHWSYDDVETYENLDSEELESVNLRRKEIFLFSHEKAIERTKFHKKNLLYFPYYRTDIVSGMSEKRLQKVYSKVEKGEISLFD